MTTSSLDDLMPTVNFANRATTQTDTDWGARIIPDCQLVYVVSGQAELFIGGKSYTIRTGECVYYGPECPHALSAPIGTDYYSVHFEWRKETAIPVHPGHHILYADDAELSSATLSQTSIVIVPYGEVTFPTHMTVSGLEPILAKIVKEYEFERPGYGLALRGLMMQAIVHILRQLLDIGKPPVTRGRIEPAIVAMHDEPGRNWAVSELAALCGYHPIHFAKLFKEELGLLPKHYIIGERIKLAKRALLNGEKIEALSERLGFTSLHYFSHQFKRVTGLTPSEFRMLGRP
ncbi:AraC family transcriptional regulator [Cohnella endophytica]|uniref:AraC family transcriptional regulator n=1 Tax=Cohnella endophytica TaxID=2419778 RepID=A0A494XQW9_9BACL|nr:AraC family transcriptional regulator [Cohnella endophytica]RKP53025.1 AraC family transcriptional regulator [Cohnella endophytica]